MITKSLHTVKHFATLRIKIEKELTLYSVGKFLDLGHKESIHVMRVGIVTSGELHGGVEPVLIDPVERIGHDAPCRR